MCQIYPILTFRRLPCTSLIEVQTHYVAAESGYRAATAFLRSRGVVSSEMYVNTDFALEQNRQHGIVNDVVSPSVVNEFLDPTQYESWLDGMVRCAQPAWKRI